MKKTEIAIQIAGRYIAIQKSEDGYDYTIFDEEYKEVDGGVYDDLSISIEGALDNILADLQSGPDYNGAKGKIEKNDCPNFVDYDWLMEKVEEAN